MEGDQAPNDRKSSEPIRSKTIPQCLNPCCKEFHFVDECSMGTAEEEKSLKVDYFKNMRSKRSERNVQVLEKQTRKQGAHGNTVEVGNASMFRSTFCDGNIDTELLANCGRRYREPATGAATKVGTGRPPGHPRPRGDEGESWRRLLS